MERPSDVRPGWLRREKIIRARMGLQAAEKDMKEHKAECPQCANLHLGQSGWCELGIYVADALARARNKWEHRLDDPPASPKQGELF